MRCTVFGTGYLGATHAAGMAELGHEVIGVDVDPGKIAKLASGDIPFYEPGLRKMLRENLEAGRLRFTTDYDAAVEFADVHFLGVGTPQKKGEYGADLRHVHAVIDTLVPRLRRSSVIVGKSTVPVGTAADLTVRARAIAPEGVDVEIAWNPEFLREGYAVHDTLHPDRIVFGVQPDSHRAEKLLRELYAPILADEVPFLVTDLQTAELVKVSANAFLATKISFINAISEVCEAVDADVTLLADALGYDPRIGRRFLNAGLGFGGGCLPKDIRAFMARAGELGANHALTFLREVDGINMRRRTRMVELTTKACGGSLLGANVGVLGAAFKPESDDVRDSPALNVAGLLQLNGATVNVYDPQAMDNSRRVFPTLNYSTSALEACERADAVLVLTEWQEFVDLDPQELAATVRAKVVVDGRNCLDVAKWQAAGWRVHALGRRIAEVEAH
ncbi:UDP-glucose/GDP-mannose dehydrogenase family protein [Mycolicibacterium arabiense]|uniref:UDP-glucose dehydrogenase family protein n=2 Tax=Mycobacteriaceae TaxID=1762 RepID=UPI0013D2981E|nr:UDP-glucose/GDP-mannose dehydrogenase family protein [Mycolicibacterium arabiense]MCV7371185.1 UDP-glucose/GDP-mannose dehydrogenase family protein [Mycolicibacterium arabiense]